VNNLGYKTLQNFVIMQVT